MGENRGCADRAGAIEPLIIVGIYNAGIKGLMSTPGRRQASGRGQADAYGRMLVEG